MSGTFLGELLSSRLPVVMEIKRRDGHGEDLLRQRSLAEIVSGYHRAGAPCLSVVTGRWFGGTEEMLPTVARLTDLPLLKKDLIVTECHLAEAEAMGAAAVLLTAGILPRSLLRRLITLALRRGMTPFVEVASERELDAVVHGEDCVVAVNNKDIQHRERTAADLGRSGSLLPAALATGTRCPVSASGITEPAQAAQLITMGFKGVLVGTGLLRAASCQQWARDFETHRRALEVLR